jgi:long-chain fatty acid transport protein
VAAVLCLSAGLAQAGGFSIYEAGARATGMGCAVTASVDDGSALFYNIAALSFMPGTVVDLNVMPVAPKMKHQAATPPADAPGRESVDQSFIIPGFGITHNPGGRLAFGLGVAAPFGLGVEWQDPETWIGRYSSYDVDLATVYVTPAVSVRITPQLSAAVGLDIAFQSIELNRYSPQEFGGDSELINVVDTQLEGHSDLNVTPCVGLMYRPTEKLSLGLMYHHEKTMNYEGGDGTLENIAPEELRAAVDANLDAAAGEPGLREFDLATELGLPHMLSLGVAYQFTEKLLVEFNAVHFGWSNFEKLALEFSPDPTEALSSEIPFNYDDKWQLRLGAAYDVTPRFTLLGGYVRDETPQPVESMGPILPDASRNDWSIGVQYTTGPWRLTASWMAVLNEARNNLRDGQPTVFESEQDDPEAVQLRTLEAGSYESVANIYAFGVGYHF